MLATRTPLTIKQGDSWRLQLQWTNPLPNTDPPEPNPADPIDLTGFTARLQVRRQVTDTGTPLLALTSSPAAGITITPLTGTLTCRATPTQTAALSGGTYVWECEVTDGIDTDTIAGGSLKVEGQVIT